MRCRSVIVVLGLALVGAVPPACSSDGDTATDDATPSEESTTTTMAAARLRQPTVEGPVNPDTGGGTQAIGIDYDFESVGYRFDEYFFEGEAAGYEATGDFAADGEWTVEETGTAPFKTRMIVVRPEDPADFSGTVFVEWFNVTGGVDAGPTFLMAHNQMLRSGAVWVGVTSQAVGLTGSETTVQSDVVDIPEGGLVGSDPERYGTLTHPGDLYSYDIFTQAGTAIRGDSEGGSPFEDLDVQRLVGIGESQSAGRLTTYINAVHPVAGEYDGFLIHSRGSGAAPLGDRPPEGEEESGIPEAPQIRTDIDTPVFTFETEYDVHEGGYADARQDDTGTFRLWEVAGTSHIDAYTGGGYSLSDLGDGAAEASLLDPAQADGGLLNCAMPLNTGSQHAPLSAALAHLETWITDGTLPPAFDRLETTGEGEGTEIVRDDLGLAEGGVRTPIVDVPVAVNVGDATNTPDFCRVFGHTDPIDAATLADLYPDGEDGYVEAFNAAVDQAVEDGIWLEPEAENFKAAAEQISVQ
jgi:hypothetical protein